MARTRVAVAGCGSVSEHYLRDLRGAEYAEVVAVCDTVPERAERRAAEFQVPHAFGSLEEMLRGPEFDLLLNLTPMPCHYPVSLAALEAGRHVLCEKPIATRLEDARRLLEVAKERGVRLFGAPNTVTSPQFACLAELARSGEIGPIHAAHARYGHPGPTWGPWFYRKGGGSLLDLGVYNLTTLTGLLGPARGVAALMGTAVAERDIEGERVRVEADDNAMLLLDHGGAVFSCVRTGFIYHSTRDEWTVELNGLKGSAYLLGHDWAPKGVEVRVDGRAPEVRCTDPQGYSWETGAARVARCLATGEDPLLSGEHALHVLEVMLAAQESSETGRRVEVRSRFPWPIAVPASPGAP